MPKCEKVVVVFFVLFGGGRPYIYIYIYLKTNGVRADRGHCIDRSPYLWRGGGAPPRPFRNEGAVSAPEASSVAEVWLYGLFRQH